MSTPQFEVSVSVAQWLLERLAGDEPLLRSLMGSGPEPAHKAMETLESEAAPQGWVRGDIDRALKLIATN